MRALITGGAGFIGSHLAERWLALGHSVCLLDDLSTGSIDNIAGIKKNPKCEYHIDTIFNRRLLAELIDAADVVFHLAAAVGVRRIVDFPVATIETNIRGSENVLELAAKKLKRVLITSTSEVYGKSTQVPFKETDDMILGSTYNARWSYACSKAIDEFLALAYFRERRMPVTVVRLFNTTGPRQSGQYGMVLPTFIRQALNGEDITVYGTGEQSRCFTHVSDIVGAIVNCVQSDSTVGEIYNLGSSEEITINDLAARVKELTHSSSSIRHVPYSEAYGPGFEDMYRRIPDISKATAAFGYRPTLSLREIIVSVAEHIQSTRSVAQTVR